MRLVDVARALAWCAIGVGATLGMIHLLLAMIGLAPTPYTRATEIEKQILNHNGFQFDIVNTDCDPIAKTNSTSICTSRVGQTDRTLLFEFVPPNPYVPLPDVSVINPHTIEISAPLAVSVFSRRGAWQGMSVRYRIGKIDYPGAWDPKQ